MCLGQRGCGDASPGGEEDGSKGEGKERGETQGAGPDGSRPQGRDQKPRWQRWVLKSQEGKGYFYALLIFKHLWQECVFLAYKGVRWSQPTDQTFLFLLLLVPKLEHGWFVYLKKRNVSIACHAPLWMTMKMQKIYLNYKNWIDQFLYLTFSVMNMLVCFLWQYIGFPCLVFCFQLFPCTFSPSSHPPLPLSPVAGGEDSEARERDMMRHDRRKDRIHERNISRAAPDKRCRTHTLNTQHVNPATLLPLNRHTAAQMRRSVLNL